MKNYKHYYKLFTEAPIVGTDTTEVIASDDEYEINEGEIREDLYASYGYCIHGWCGDDPTEEEYEDFIAECTVELTEISKEEFEMAVEDGFPYNLY